MARSMLTIASLGVPCAAFLPQGNLRAQPPSVAQSKVNDAAMPMQQPAGTSTGASSALFGLSIAGAAVAAFRTSRRSTRSVSNVNCRVTGTCFPIVDKWDPLNLASSDAKMERYTAVEIKHGRVAMIACLGYALPEFFHFPGCEGFENGLGAFSTLPIEGWVQLIAFIGAHEVLVKPRAGGLGSFDLGLGTELLEGISEDELDRRQTVERNNGRLAMIGIWGIVVQEYMFSKTPIAMFRSEGWWGSSVDWFIKDIPICQEGPTFCAVKTAKRGPGLTAMQSNRAARSQVTAMRAKLYYSEAAEEPRTRMSTSMPFLYHPEHLDGWVGGEKGFDPIGWSDSMPVYYLRECELKHGRVCMLAALGWMATDLGVRFPGDMFQTISTVEAHDKMVEAGLMQPFLATIAVCEVYGGWLWRKGMFQEIQRDAGDFFLGKNFLPKDEDKAREMKLKELENGRLAMVAFSGMCTQAVLTGKTFPFL